MGSGVFILSRSQIQFRLLINFGVLAFYFLAVQAPQDAPNWFALLVILIWGAFTFRTIISRSDGGIYKISVTGTEFLRIWFFGALLVAVFGIFVIPFLVFRDAVDLYAILRRGTGI